MRILQRKLVITFNKFSQGRTISLMTGPLNLVNKDKSHFLVHSNAFNITKDMIKRITVFKQKEGPITYLGFPLYIGRPRIIYFSDLINKVVNRITGWKAKILSYGGRNIFVKHVLHSLPIHLVWYWFEILKLCAWPFKSTLWGDFLRAKYCQRSNPISKKWDTGESLIWKHLMHNKLRIEEDIRWKINSGVGPLANFSSESNRFNNSTVADSLIKGQWNVEGSSKKLLIKQCGSLLQMEISVVLLPGMSLGRKGTRISFIPLFGIKASLLNVLFQCGEL
ncbi:hypothetical protein H5410_030592 [Solanum commersonii]|uniref:Uncharacterized protein n=1 Tax=Solanum commersonii TaxID=4109 RepID=A0A9J5YJT3_SOLCO|nr:hypothetical protein H5410_030592 [Solanum commersonii]